MLTATFQKTSFVPRRREELHEIAIPTADEVAEATGWTPTSRWSPVQHGALVDAVVASASKRGFEVANETWATDRRGWRLWGSLDFERNGESAHGISLPDDVGLSIGIFHGNDGSIATRIASGARVFICQNGMIVAEYVLTRKHTTGFDLPVVADEALDLYLDGARKLPAMIEELRGFDFSSPTEVDHVLVEAGRRGVLPWSAIGKVEKEWREPRHSEFRDRNGWSLLNSFTQVAKTTSVRQQATALREAQELVVEFGRAGNERRLEVEPVVEIAKVAKA